MRYWTGPLLVLAITLALIGWAKSATLDDKLRVHMDWIAENSRFEASAQLPNVVRVSDVDWQLNGWLDMGYAAVYDKGTVYIPDYERTREATWVHELAHHYQWLNGEMPPGTCKGLHEPEAYALQEQWMHQMGMGELSNAEKWHKIHSQAMCRMQDSHGP